MAPPNRTQDAANALLNTASIANRSLAAAVAQSAKSSSSAKSKKITCTMTQVDNNPYSTNKLPSSSARRNAGINRSSSIGISSSNMKKGSTSKIIAGTKRPLSNIRGKNDSRGASNTPSSVSVFDRRNKMDRISKRDAPITDTDKNLMALLDDDGGPSKKKSKVVKQRSSTTNNDSLVLPNNALENGVGRRVQKVDNNNSSRMIGVVTSSGVIMPPPPSYSSIPTTKQPIKSTKQSLLQKSSRPKKRSINKRINNCTNEKDWKMYCSGGGNISSVSLKNEGKKKKVVNDVDERVEIGDYSSVRRGEDKMSSVNDYGMADDYSTNVNCNNLEDMDYDTLDITMDTSSTNDKGSVGGQSSLSNSYQQRKNLKSIKVSSASTGSISTRPVPTLAKDDDEEEDVVVLSLGIGNKRTKVKPRHRGSSVVGSSSKCCSINNTKANNISLEETIVGSNNEEETTAQEMRNVQHIEGSHDLLSATPKEPEADSYTMPSYDDGDIIITTRKDDDNSTNYADWYDPEEFAKMEKEAAAEIAVSSSTSNNNADDMPEHEMASSSTTSKRGKKMKKTKAGGINDNFVRLDLRNSAGSCRGARNLKKVNKQKLWRAQHRFGMSDQNNAKNDEEAGGDDGMGNIYQQQRSYKKRGANNKNNGGDLKCFASAKNAGVDPLDDFVDGVFSVKEKEDDSKQKKKKKQSPSVAPSRDDSVPICTRHQRPCKLLTVKRNNKGNKGRKFYVCSLPRGEQCDFFKWEEDTVEATQRALLKSSSSSGFIARQVDAARKRFKELTVPELRIEAKKRGLRATGKKDQILTRLVIWIRDEIANTVEPDADPSNNSDLKSNGNIDGSDDEADSDADAKDSDEESSSDSKTKPDKAATKQLIELSDDESSYGDDDDDDDDSDDDEDTSSDELEICSQKKNATSTKSDPTLHDSLEKYFGYTEFREGQEWAIQRCFSNERTLLVAPTGQGKSLCYALPAALMDGICLVVSPLISLMQDQLRQLPPKIPAATLSGSMTTAQMALIVDDIMRGRYKVLFVSPERLASAAFRRLVRPKFNVETREYERQFPTVSLLCVDEAHCLSQWGHNFRPSYLRVRSLIPLIEPKSILALTATAGPMVVRDICNTLRIPYGGENQLLSPEMPIEASTLDDGVKVLNCNRDNIDVYSLVLQSNDERRFLLHKILKEKKGASDKRSKKLPVEEGCLSKGSVIIYVWRQKDTEIVAEQLNGAGIRGGIVCYHGGMASNDRSRAQSQFLRGKARICVATVAFGLGINKADIVGVIHLCLPPSPEHYLQEIGRAGRDGRAAKAIALPLEEEFISRHSLAHSDRLSGNQLEIVFLGLQKLVNEALNDISPEAGVDLAAEKLFLDDIHVAMPVTQTVDASDCKEEWIETIFSLLEEETKTSKSHLSVEGYLPDAATITLKKRSLDKLEKYEQIAQSIAKCGIRVDAQDEHPNNAAGAGNSVNRYQGDFGGTAMEKGFYAYSFGTYKFSIVRCARCMGPNIEPRHVYAALRRLQGNGELELVLDTTANGRALHLKMRQDGINLFRSRNVKDSTEHSQETIELSDDVSVMISKLTKQFSAKEKVGVSKVESMYEIMYQVSKVADSEVVDDGEEEEKEEKGEEEKEEKEDGYQTYKSSRLVKFQKMVQSYFSNTPSTHEAPQVIKDFPLHKAQPIAYLSSDISLLMQVLAQSRQEQIHMAVHINEPKFAEYRNLALAKIFHSIDAPRAPILQWYSHQLWGKYRNYSFSSLVLAVKKTFDNE